MTEPTCACVVCRDLPHRADDEATYRHVVGYGWSVVWVGGGRSDFAYTIGLWHTFRQPELVMFGLGRTDMAVWLNACVTRCQVHGWPAGDEPFDGVIEGFRTRLRPVDPSWHDAMFGTATRFYLDRVPVRQLVWPDRNGVWPWQDGATGSSRERQAFAWLPVDRHPDGAWRLVGELSAGFPFPGGPDQLALTTSAVLDGARPVRRAVRHDDAFDILDARGYDADDLRTAYLGELLRRHPDLARHADLPDGQVARLDPDGGWTVSALTAAERATSAEARSRCVS